MSVELIAERTFAPISAVLAVAIAKLESLKSAAPPVPDYDWLNAIDANRPGEFTYECGVSRDGSEWFGDTVGWDKFPSLLARLLDEVTDEPDAVLRVSIHLEDFRGIPWAREADAVAVDISGFSGGQIVRTRDVVLLEELSEMFEWRFAEVVAG